MITTGRKPLGFLNPWLYGSGLAGLNDITSGSNPGCNTNGFSAASGWDPVRSRLVSPRPSMSVHPSSLRLQVSGRSTLPNWGNYLVMGSDPCKPRHLFAITIPRARFPRSSLSSDLDSSTSLIFSNSELVYKDV